MIKIYDTLEQKLKDFVPNNQKVNMYVCGPTVYGDIHLGNARPIIFFDIVKRYLVYKGYKVNYISNITDVDDKIINKAIELNVSEKEVAEKYTKKYFEVIEKVGSNKPDIIPQATNYIKEMIDFIDLLIKKDYAYEKNGNVYFRVAKNKTYGSLSNQNIFNLDLGNRIDISIDKENPADFNLWKKTNIGIKYPSKWSDGRPGWHTECVVMNDTLIKGETLTIHGGGFDLKFPHHENERIQYLAKNNKELADFWMHVGRLDINDEKMSKSLNNIILVDDLEKQNYNLYSYRLLIIAHNYRQPINFNIELLDQYQEMYIKFIRAFKKTKINLIINEKIEEKKLDDNFINEFNDYMDNDFNTPNVISLLLNILKVINTNQNNYEILNKSLNSFKIILDILGIKIDDVTKYDVKNYLEWKKFVSEKNYEKADKLRKELMNNYLL